MDSDVTTPIFDTSAARDTSRRTSSRSKKDKAPRLDPMADVPYQPTEPDKVTRRPKGSREIEDGLTQAFVFAGMGMSMVNLYDGMVIGENAQYLAQRWTKVADKNPTVRKWLILFLEGGDWATALVG